MEGLFQLILWMIVGMTVINVVGLAIVIGFISQLFDEE